MFGGLPRNSQCHVLKITIDFFLASRFLDFRLSMRSAELSTFKATFGGAAR
jgi:hypothetical protein